MRTVSNRVLKHVLNVVEADARQADQLRLLQDRILSRSQAYNVKVQKVRLELLEVLRSESPDVDRIEALLLKMASLRSENWLSQARDATATVSTVLDRRQRLLAADRLEGLLMALLFSGAGSGDVAKSLPPADGESADE